MMMMMMMMMMSHVACGMASAFGASVCGSEYRDTWLFRPSAYIAISISCSVTAAHDAWNLMGLKRRGGKRGGDQWLSCGQELVRLPRLVKTRNRSDCPRLVKTRNRSDCHGWSRLGIGQTATVGQDQESVRLPRPVKTRNRSDCPRLVKTRNRSDCHGWSRLGIGQTATAGQDQGV